MGAFYGFQKTPDVRQVTSDRGWLGWFLDKAQPVISSGTTLLHLHNPFGLYDIRDRLMHIDQFKLAQRAGLDWLANPCRFASAVELVHLAGGRVHAYVGSPLTIPSDRRFKLSRRCARWQNKVMSHIDVLLDAGVDAIGFDASWDFSRGDCMYGLVEKLISRGIEIMIEPWPRRDRDYPFVSWIIRELLYRRITVRRKPEETPVEEVKGSIYRIVPAHDTEAGLKELREIEELTGIHFENSQAVVDSIRSEGHIPLVRVHQLLSGLVS